MTKLYFAKYLPVGINVTSDIWQWNNNVNNTGWEHISCSDMDGVIAHGLDPSPEFRKVKLFLCSRDIQIGDIIFVINSSLKEFIIEDEMYIKTIIESGEHFFAKKIGEISPEATWVKEGDEFEEDKILILKDKEDFDNIYGADYVDEQGDIIGFWDETGFKTFVAIKGPCGHFH